MQIEEQHDERLALRLMVIITVVITPIFFVNAANDVAALLFARGTEFLSVLDQAGRGTGGACEWL